MNCEDRIAKLEDEVKQLRENSTSSSPDKKKKKVKSDGPKRAPSTYNKFVKAYIDKLKEESAASGEKFAHTKAFGDAAKAWNAQKEQSKKDQPVDKE